MPDMTIDERRRALYPELFMSADERAAANSKLTAEMKQAAQMLEFEHAAHLRDRIAKLRGK